MLAQGTTDNGNAAWLDEQIGVTISPEDYAYINIIGALWKEPNMEKTKLEAKLTEFSSLLNNDTYNKILTLYLFYLRDPRHGLGRKDSSRIILKHLCDRGNKKQLLKQYFESGYWGDAMKLLVNPSFVNYKDTIEDIVTEQLLKDLKTEDKISNCAKWVKLSKPHKNRTDLSYSIAKKMFPNIPANKTYCEHKNGKVDFSKVCKVDDNTPLYFKYRTLISKYEKTIRKLRKQIPYVEKYMQKGSYNKINPAVLTGSNRLRLDKAFKNIPGIKLKFEGDIRYEDPDRIEFAEKYKQYNKGKKEELLKKKERLQELRNKKDKTEEEQQELNNITTSIAPKTETPVDIYKAYNNCKEVNDTYENCIQELALTFCTRDMNMLCVADTSGSMYSGSPINPIDVSISLTAFCSMTSSCFKHQFIQFSDTAYLVDMYQVLNREPTFYDYITYMKNHQVNAGSTNFESVLNLLKELLSNKDKEDYPKYLIFFSDMQFNQAVTTHNKGLTASQQLQVLFGDKAPTIIFWNLGRSNTSPCLLNEDNVILLSGYSTNMIKDLDKILLDKEILNNMNKETEQQQVINGWENIIKTLLAFSNSLN